MSGAPRSDATHWRDVEAVFAAVVEAPLDQRPSLLAAATAGRDAVRADVERLLRAHDSAGPFITPMTVGGPAHVDHPAPSLTGAIVGSFRLTGLIGEGGMGSVYRAERVSGDFTQHAAVKIMTSRLATSEATRRFRIERQILASLQHPNIVSLIDGGVTADGQPFLVMQVIDGVPVTKYCHDRGLPLRERVALFQQLCGAVRFAHQHLVVHRDLKPGNVLVTDDGIIKVLDFGIAKLLQPDGSARDATASLTGPLTPDYASPEQLRGVPVTTASDVYSLGVLLYELLTDRKPYQTRDLSLDTVLTMVTEQEPPSPGAIAPALKGDLDAIILKAMAKSVDRRYASVGELADDLQRWLDGRPVLARPESRAYVINRFVRRHRMAVGSAAVAVLAVLSALGVAIWQARVARIERDRAEAEARTAQTTTQFLAGIFDAANPVTARGATITATDLLNSGAARIATALADEPDAQGRLLVIMGNAYMRMGDPKQGYDLAKRALDLARAGQNPKALADATYLMGQMLRRFGQTPQSIAPLEESAALHERIYGAGDSRLAEVLRDLALATAAVKSRAEARPLLERAIRIQEQRAPRSASLGRMWNNLGNMQLRDGDTAAAEAAFAKSIAIYEQSNEPESWGIALPLLSLGDALRAREDFNGARALFERALVVDDETYGRVSTSSAYTLARLGELAVAQGRLDDARRLLTEARGIYARTESLSVGARIADTFFARLLLAEGRASEARPLLTEALEKYERENGAEHLDTAAALVELAAADVALRRTKDATTGLQRALAIRRKHLRPLHADLVRPLTMLASLTEQRDDRRRLLEEAVGAARATLPEHHSERVLAERSLLAVGAG